MFIHIIHIIISSSGTDDTSSSTHDSFSKDTFTNDEATGAINEEAIGANKGASNPPSCFFISCFTVSVTPSINTSAFSSYFMILIILSISSIEINKVNTFPALTVLAPTLLPRIFLSILSVTDEVAVVAYCGKIFLAKRTAIFISALVHHFPKKFT